MTQEKVGGLAARLPLMEGAALALVGLACLVFQLRLPAQLPVPADDAQVRAVLEAEQQPGDVVVLSPWWAERARTFVPPSLTVTGYQGVEHDDLLRHPRIWVLAQPGLPGTKALGPSFAAHRTPVGAARRLGAYELSLYENGRARPVTFSLVERLASARAYLEGPGGERQPCGPFGGGFRCPNGAVVAAGWHEVRFAPRECVTLNPPGGATKLVLELDAAPASTQLRLYAGYTWDRGFFTDGVTDSEVALEVDGAVTPLLLPKGLEALQAVSVASPRPGATVRLKSRADNANARDVCVELYGLGGAL